MIDSDAGWQASVLQDPDKFPKLSRKGDWETLLAVANNDLRELLAGQIIGFSIPNWGGPNSADLSELYRYCLNTGMSDDHRHQVYLYVRGAIEQLSFCTVGVFLPFLVEEPELHLASSAAIDYVSYGPLIGGDPMSRVKEVIGLIERLPLANPGAVFGGLMSLGDPRAYPLLRPLKDLLPLADLQQTTQCFSGFMSAACVEFILDWLEGLEGVRDDVLFGALIANLLRQKDHMAVPMVMTGLRPFPVASVTPEEQAAMAKWISFAEYRQRIAPRMLALERAEPPPKSMSYVIARWGIADRDVDWNAIHMSAPVSG